MAEDAKRTSTKRSERIGRYEILSYIAKGGMGAVYKARDTDLDRVVALKVLPPDIARQPTMLDRFKREARAAAKLRHENIVAIYDVGEAAGTHFLAMEFVAGTDLGNYIHKKGKMAPGLALKVLRQAAYALDHAHREGIVHRDIKPANFLLTEKNKELIVKLTDMGLARHTEENDETRLTRHGMTVGTVDYMSPEQARNSADADIRSDIYSLGCTLFHMLAGEPPFPKGTLTERLLLHQEAQPPDIRDINAEVPEFLRRVLLKMVAKKPDQRYPTPAALLYDLDHPDEIAAPGGSSDDAAPASSEAPPPAGEEEVDLFSSLPASAIAPAPEATPAPSAPTRPTSPAPRVARPPVTPQVSSYEVKALPGEEPLKPAPLTPRPVRPAAPPRKSTPKVPAAGPGKGSKPPVPAKRFRDEELDEEEDEVEEKEEAEKPPKESVRRSKKGSGPPLAVLAGAGALALVVILIVVASSSRPRPVDTPKKETGKAPEARVQPPPEEEPETPLPVPKVAANAADMGPGTLDLPVLSPAEPDDRTTLVQDMRGSFTAFPAPAAGAPVIKVGRTAAPGPTSCRTLAEALTRSEAAETVIEIHDQGPMFLTALPPLGKRRVFIRGGAGYRPLLAWESAGGSLATLNEGGLVLDNLDLVIGGSEAGADTALFQLHGASFHARNCTFASAGKKAGLTLARLDGGAGSRGPLRFHLQRCYARGPNLTVLGLFDTPAEALIEDSLLLTTRGPIIDGRSRDDESVELRLVRSTLVSAQNLIVWRPAVKGGTPVLHGHVLDSLLARSTAAAAEGDLLRVSDGGVPRLITWRAINGVYAGWKRLLASDQRTILGSDLNSWQTQFFYRETDRALADTWPARPPAQPDELPASSLSQFGTPVAFAARSVSGAVGCATGALPPEPEAWQRRTFERRPLGLAAATETAGTPTVPDAGDGLYHGERITANQVGDLGAYLQKHLQGDKLAPRIVFRLAGSGVVNMSPVRIRGVKEVVIYVEPPATGKAAPLELVADARASSGRAALFEVEGGNLELIGVRTRFANERAAAAPAYVVKIQGGDLSLSRCQLVGSMTRPPDSFKGLIDFGGARAGADQPAVLSVRDCLLLSGKAILHLADAGAHVRLRNNIAMSLSNAVEIDAPTRVGGTGGIVCGFERNTWAFRLGFLSIRAGADVPPRPDLVAVQSTNDYFVDPYDPNGQAALLRYQGGAVDQGVLTWLGRKNIFDQRLQGFYAPLGPSTPEKQGLKDWQALWGPGGEVDAATVGPTQPARLVSINPDYPQFDRLALPRDPRFDPLQPPAGADLKRLSELWTSK